MPPLEDQEEILYTTRKHWFVFVGQAFFIFVLALLPSLLLFAPELLPTQLLTTFNDLVHFQGNFNLSVFFLWTLELLVLCIVFFLLWTDYYLDAWIVTNLRVIAIEQRGLFDRNISTFRLDMIQDATVKVPGVLATILRFGTVEVNTASEESFVFRGSARPYELKERIMEEHHRARGKKQEVSIKPKTTSM